MKTSEFTEDIGAIQKGADFLQAFMMGFELQDAVALLRIDDLFIDSFKVCICGQTPGVPPEHHFARRGVPISGVHDAS
jgi:rRNA processing protein Krr1/Pno1